MATLKAIKMGVRRRVALILRSLTQEEINKQTEQVAACLLRQTFFHQSKNVACYLSMPNGEIDTSPLVSAILQSGKSLFVPKLDPTVKGRMNFLRVYGEDDLASFPAGLWGIREPSDQYKGQKRQTVLDEDSETLDLILVPAVAFDHSFGRLGHGKGYYDRFLTQYKSTNRRMPLLVGLGLSEQILEDEDVPMGEFDWIMDAIVGPSGILHRPAAGL